MTCWTHRTKYRLSFIVMIVLTFMLCLSKIFIGYKENSLSLISSSFHLTSDLAALLIGYCALNFSEQRVGGKFTFGGVRAEVLGAIINAIFLIAICFSLSVESLKRLIVPDSVEHPEPVLIVGIIALLINVFGLYMFRCESCACIPAKERNRDVVQRKKFSTDLIGDVKSTECERHGMMEDESQHGRERSVSSRPSYQLNIHAVFLHILQHVFVTIVVIVSALIVIYSEGGWSAYVDPALSIVVVLFILKTSIPLLKECLSIFMQTAPAGVQLVGLKETLLRKVPEVVGIHELHIWQLAGHQVVGSVHVVFRSHRACSQDAINKIKKFFVQEGISHITIQPEFSDALQERSEYSLRFGGLGNSEDDCLLLCSERKCAYLTCCETPKKMLAKLLEEH